MVKQIKGAQKDKQLKDALPLPAPLVYPPEVTISVMNALSTSIKNSTNQDDC